MSEPGVEERPFRWTEVQIRRKFKHAAEFGIGGPYNRANATAFAGALATHVADVETRAIPIRFGRGAGSGGFAAMCYLNDRTELAVITTRDGRFVTGYRLSDDQLAYVLRHGKLGGGT